MTSSEIRQSFLDFFKSKQHKIVPSAPMVMKDDPTLMFTNAGMNQFKEIFLGEAEIKGKRIADTQKCLRVSGKHNDLEEVGHDTYHHTMFEMLGNWSFGDYFKKEAIEWAWEYLTDVLKINKENLYATVFEGSKEDGTEADAEAKSFWKKYLPENQILYGNKKDNFWEMGASGPCGPCSEIHIDLRDEKEKAKIPGRELVNKDHPLVIEIWNLVFIQYNRKSNGKLENLPAKHVDTGMGFERLCMVVQGKKSNYDTDIFQILITKIEEISGKKYGINNELNIAMRVIADHLRAVAFSITDGQLPSNTGAGYVIRRILRRAVRYGYSFLDIKNPFIYQLVDTLAEIMGQAFPELLKQKEIIIQVIKEEEISFLRTLETGIRMLDGIIAETKKNNYKVVNGRDVFTLFDSYGFPYGLTELILRENGLIISKKDFDEAMAEQKNRSKADASGEKGDWITVSEDDIEEFIGYDHLETELKITRYRKVTEKNKDLYHLVFNYTPFYAESGGQVGDKGYIEANGKKTYIVDTQKELGVIIHYSESLPEDLHADFYAVVDRVKRELTTANHSATHLMHKALRDILGAHVEQKGSLVDEKRLRFDFSHFKKMSDEEIEKVERTVNACIRENITLEEKRDVPMPEAKKMGATALFGEKYGDLVRIIKFGESIELCGGNHVSATGKIGFFKIVSESAVAAGIRRIEAITSLEAENYIFNELKAFKEVKSVIKSSKNIKESIEKVLTENKKFKSLLEKFEKEKTKHLKQNLKNKIQEINGINVIAEKIEGANAQQLKDIAFQLKGEIVDLFFAAGIENNGKANLAVMISDNLIKNKGLNAGQIIREISKEIKGGGGGPAHFASAGGTDASGIERALEKATEFIK
ncbi:MAG: alanine--tRNA ligase [Bacteroidetes bacterium]|nr:MAG: alanine--tRNA ligase [Bacteroidota bacterium]